GPGDVIGTYQHWKRGEDDPGQVSVTYSGQFYDVCRDLGAHAYVLACCPKPGSLHEGRFTFLYRPIPFEHGPGSLYHLGQFWYALRLAFTALLFRADVAVITNGSGHWFPLILLAVCGVKVVPSLHCVLWPKHRPPHGVNRLVQKLDAVFFGR